VLDLRRKKTAEVSLLLQSRKYDTIQGDTDYKYLVRLPMDSVTAENVEKIIKEKERKEAELKDLQKKSETQIWLDELKTLKEEYIAIYKKPVKLGGGATTVKKILKVKANK
jgi:DNA topoisomerase-2